MGLAKRELERLDSNHETAIRIALDASSIEECEYHEGFYTDLDDPAPAFARAKLRKHDRPELLAQIRSIYASAENRADVEDIELHHLDTSFKTPFLSNGLQVHMPYTAYAHWVLMQRLL